MSEGGCVEESWIESMPGHTWKCYSEINCIWFHMWSSSLGETARRPNLLFLASGEHYLAFLSHNSFFMRFSVISVLAID